MKIRPFEAVYVHVPFCAKRKCAYCAFFSIPNPPSELVNAYLEKIERQLEQYEPLAPVKSVYLGGGTPTALPNVALKRLFDSMRRHIKLLPNAEISIECNPGTLTEEKTAIVAEFANRVSLGVQSFVPELLETLGRDGSTGDFKRALKLLRAEKIENISCDLIHSIPGQSAAQWKNDLEKAADSGVSHISTYSLTIEEGTALARRGIDPTDQNLDAEMWELAGDLLATKGFARYEISNFAKMGRECRHNMDVWMGGTLLGVGPAAASFDGRDRWTLPADIAAWLNGAPPEIDALPEERRAAEILAMGLRTATGWNPQLFEKRTGFKIIRWQRELELLERHGLMEIEHNHIRPTLKGMELWDEIAEHLL